MFPQTSLGFALCDPVLAASVRANQKPRPVGRSRLRLEQVVDIRLAIADVYDAAPVPHGSAGPSQLLRCSQTVEPAHAFLFFGGLRQLVGRLARISVQRQHPERASTFSERQRRMHHQPAPAAADLDEVVGPVPARGIVERGGILGDPCGLQRSVNASR